MIFLFTSTAKELAIIDVGGGYNNMHFMCKYMILMHTLCHYDAILMENFMQLTSLSILISNILFTSLFYIKNFEIRT